MRTYAVQFSVFSEHVEHGVVNVEAIDESHATDIVTDMVRSGELLAHDSADLFDGEFVQFTGDPKVEKVEVV